MPSRSTRLILIALTASLVLAEPFNTVNQADIEAYLTKYDSPMAGLGFDFIDHGCEFNIDPRLLLAIARQETTLGTLGTCSQFDNPFNWFFCLSEHTCSQSDPPAVKCPKSSYIPFGGWARSIQQVSKYVGKHMGEGRLTIPLIKQYFCTTPDCGDWADKVTGYYTALGGDPNRLRFTCPCGDGIRQGKEECDGTDDQACPGQCNAYCKCPGCGNGTVEGTEQCDGTATPSPCPLNCLSNCTCSPCRYVSIPQGDPKVPGDGMSATGVSDGNFPFAGEQLQLLSPFEAAGGPAGVTVSVFPVESIGVESIFAGIGATDATCFPQSCNGRGSGWTDAPTGTVSVNGVAGFYLNVPPGQTFAGNCCSGVTDDVTYLSIVFADHAVNHPIDAAAVCSGQNVFPP